MNQAYDRLGWTTCSTPLPSEAWVKADQDLIVAPYSTVYPSWTGWVRRGEDRDGDLLIKDPYSRKEALLLRHPAFAGASEAKVREVLLLHLLGYLEATLWLESDLVNVVNRDLARGRLLPFLPEAARLDALRIAGDEDGHSVFTAILRDRFEAERKAEPVTTPSYGEAARALAADLARTAPEHQGLVRFFWAVAIETLITANLTSVTVDETVNPLVRAVLRDHALDEARHHRYFADLFRLLAPNLTKAGTAAAHEFLASALSALLRPDHAWLADASRALGQKDPTSIAHELVVHPAVKADIQASAAPTLRLIGSVFDLGSDAIRAPYSRIGLLS